MDTIISHLRRRLTLLKSSESERIGLSANRKLMQLWRLCLIGLLIVIPTVAFDAQQEDEKERGVTPVEEAVSSLDFGTYHALIIGINEYSVWPRLDFAEKDASDIRQILITRYGFASDRVTYLSGANATRSKILSGLRGKLESLAEDDNLLVYYAGHGQLDPLTENGYWIPVEAGLYDESGWIAFSNITTLLTGRGVKAKNVMVLTDSCYGGALARSGPTPGHRGPTDEDYQHYEQRLSKLAKKRSRQIIASGGYEQVPDRSVFAELLKQALKENTYPMIDLEYLFFGKVYPQLKFIGQQEPALTRLVSGPEEDGQFVLLQKTAVAQSTPPPQPIPETTTQEASEPTPQPEPKAVLTVRSNVYDDMVYIDGQAKGSTRLDLELEPGPHAVFVEKEGYQPYEQQVELMSGENVTVHAQLKPITPKVAAAPVIDSFEADPSHIPRGQSAMLHWRTQHAEAAEITGIGRVPLSGSMPIEPGETMNYVLIATNEQGLTAERETQITVAIEAPRIVSFRASPSSISQGASSTLSWQTENAQTVHISGIGRVELTGSMRVHPSETATYDLIAENEQGVNIEKALTVAVASTLPRILSFQVDRPTVNKGETSKLRWQVSDATEVSINGKNVRSSDSMAVNPRKSSTYVLTAKNREGATVAEELRIRVVVPGPEIVRFEATSPIAEGSSTTLTWRTVNTEQVEISGIGRVSLSGTQRVALNTTTTYTLTAKNWDGSQVKQKATVNVKPKIGKLAVTMNQKIAKSTVKVYPNPEKVCYDQVQGKIAWEYKGSKQWAKGNLQRLCRGTSNGNQPAKCFDRVMHGGINYGGGTSWQWENAIDLCEGTNNASKTISCFQNKIRTGAQWQSAIRACQTR